MKFRKVLAIIMAVAMGFAFASCSKKQENSTVIKLGTIGPKSGDGSVYGLGVANGYKLAIKTINAAGGITVDGKAYTFESVGEADDQLDSEKSVSAFTQLVSKGMQFCMGPTTSGCSEAVVKANTTGMLMITPSGTADTLTIGSDGDDRVNRSYVFRACFADSYQGGVMAKYATIKEYKKVVICYNPADVYSKGLYDAFVKQYGTYGTITKITYDKTTFSNLTASLTSAITDADVIYIPDYYQTATSIIKQAIAAGFKGAYFGPDGFDGILSVYDTTTINDLDTVVYTNHFAADSTDEGVKAFVAAYKAEYGEDPSSFAALAYDAVYILKAAIEKANSTDNAKVVAAMSEITVKAVTGTITFDANGNPVKDVVLVGITSGKQHFIQTLNLSDN